MGIAAEIPQAPSPSGAPHIELATPAAASEVFALFEQFDYAGSELDAESFAACWRHQFFGSSPQQACVFLARDENGRLVGHYGVLPFAYVVNGVKMRGGFICQLFIHPDFRGTPLFFDMEKMLLDRYREFGFDFLYGLITIKSVLRAHLNLGFARGADLHIYVMPLKVGRGLRTLRPGTPAVLERALNQIGKFSFGLGMALAATTGPGVEIEEVLDFAALDEDLLRRAAPDAGIFAERSPETFRRRFVSFGRKRYRVFAAVSAGRRTGYLVARRALVHGFDAMTVVDLAVPAAHRAAARALLLHAGRLGLDAGCDAVAGLARPDSAAAELLRSCLFVRTSSHFTLIADKRSPMVMAGTAWASQWQANWFDHDFI